VSQSTTPATAVSCSTAASAERNTDATASISSLPRAAAAFTTAAAASPLDSAAGLATRPVAARTARKAATNAAEAAEGGASAGGVARSVGRGRMEPDDAAGGAMAIQSAAAAAPVMESRWGDGCGPFTATAAAIRGATEGVDKGDQVGKTAPAGAVGAANRAADGAADGVAAGSADASGNMAVDALTRDEQRGPSVAGGTATRGGGTTSIAWSPPSSLCTPSCHPPSFPPLCFSAASAAPARVTVGSTCRAHCRSSSRMETSARRSPRIADADRVAILPPYRLTRSGPRRGHRPPTWSTAGAIGDKDCTASAADATVIEGGA